MKPIFYFLLVILSIQFLIQSVLAIPVQVVIIRHAEKPESGSDLSELGWRRARALPDLFRENEEIKKFGNPVAIYAFMPKKDDGSLRGIQTVSFLAQELNLEINKKFRKDDYEKLAEEILNSKKYDGKSVLICWQHSFIPMLAKALGGKKAPKEWNDEIFNHAWILRYSNYKVKEFLDVPQLLLPEDE